MFVIPLRIGLYWFLRFNCVLGLKLVLKCVYVFSPVNSELINEVFNDWVVSSKPNHSWLFGVEVR